MLIITILLILCFCLYRFVSPHVIYQFEQDKLDEAFSAIIPALYLLKKVFNALMFSFQVTNTQII